MLIDSGATHHFITPTLSQQLNIPTSPATDPLLVRLPDGAQLDSSATCLLPLPGVSAGCRQAHVIDGLQEPSLLAIAPFCDNGMSVTFTGTGAKIQDKHGQIVLQGTRNARTRMWEFDPNATWGPTARSFDNQSAANRIFHCPKENNEMVAYFHAALCYPSESTLIKAIDKGFVALPGLTAALVRKYPQRSWATAYGHLDRTQQGILSTKNIVTSDSATGPEEVETDRHNITPIHVAQVALLPIPKETVHSDPTGRLPVISGRGHQYIMIVFSEDANYILPIPMRNRTKEEHTRAFGLAHGFFRSHGFPSTLHFMDNETSQDTRDYLAAFNVNVQLVPPSNHRANKAERAIRTFKNHFVAATSTLPPSFPPSLWDLLLPQIELSLNLLRGCRTKPSLSAWEAVNGAYSFLRHPIAPLGTPVLIFESPVQRPSYAPHGVPGFYLGPSFAHYRCYTCWAAATRAVRITDTVSWHPISAPFPTTQPDQLLARLRHQFEEPQDSLSPEQQQELIGFLDAAATLISLCPPRSFPRDREGPHTPPGYAPFKTLNPFDGRTRPQDPAVSSLPIPKTVPSVDPRLTVPLPRVVAPEIHTDAPLPRVGNTEDGPPLQARTPSEPPPTPHVFVPPVLEADTAVPGLPAAEYVGTPTALRDRPRRTHLPPHRTPDEGYTYRSSIPRSPGPVASLAAMSLPSLGQLLRGPDAAAWTRAYVREFVRLIDEWKAMEFIPYSELPAGAITHIWNAIPSVKTDADDNLTLRIRGCVNPHGSTSDQDVAALTAALQPIKLLLNKTVSEDRFWSTADIKDFYLHTLLGQPEFMKIPFKCIPEATREQYGLHAMYGSTDGCALVRVKAALFGLPQSGKLAQDELIPRLVAAGYHPLPNTPMCFANESKSVIFALVVDDFGISATSPEAKDHLLQTLREHYPITDDPLGRKFLGMRVEHDRQQRTLTISMPGYVQQACERFKISAPSKLTETPLPYNRPNYGQAIQLPVTDETPLLDAAGKLFVQQAVGAFQYYAQSIDFSMIAALSKIASKQSAPTEHTLGLLRHFLSYAASYPDAAITYRPSNMQLVVHSDAAYLSEWNARSRTAGIDYLGTIDGPINGIVDARSVIMKNVVPSVAEAEYGSIFANAQSAIPLRNSLADLGYPQQATPIITDNACAMGIANKTLKARRSKSMDVKFHWIQDQIKLKIFRVIWRPGRQNIADYVSKIHTPRHHQFMRGIFFKSRRRTPPSILELPPQL